MYSLASHHLGRSPLTPCRPPQILRCLDSNWSPVQQNQALPPGYQTVALVRNPIDRFAAALSEVMVRTFLGECPEGKCNCERDFYCPKSVAGIESATHWYPIAKLIFDKGAGGSSPSKDALVHLASLGSPPMPAHGGPWPVPTSQLRGGHDFM